MESEFSENSDDNNEIDTDYENNKSIDNSNKTKEERVISNLD